jgi:hypothetical protein
MTLSPRNANALLFDLQDDGFPSGNLDCLADPVSQNGSCEWRGVGNRAEGRIGLILANNAECLLAAVIPAQANCGPERTSALDRRARQYRTSLRADAAAC